MEKQKLENGKSATKKNSKAKSSIKMAGNLLVAGVVGAAIGLLIAPNKGRKSRKLIANGAVAVAKSMKEKLNDKTIDVVNKAKTTVDRIKNHSIDDLKDKVESFS